MTTKTSKGQKKTLKFLLAEAKKIRKDLVSIYDYDFFVDDFCGACGVASFMLWKVAQKRRIPLTLESSFDHCWCKLGETVIDPTFSQYDERIPVYIGPPRRDYHGAELLGDAALKDFKRWPPDQNPFSEYHKNKLAKWFRAKRISFPSE